MSEFHVIEHFRFADGVLSMQVAELLEGAPDGLIGLPLSVLPNSRWYAVRIGGVGHFNVSPEPMVVLSKAARRITNFLFEELGSPYLVEWGWAAATFNLTRPKPQEPHLRHYVVHAENFVLNVLSAHEPEVREAGPVET